MLAEVPAYVDFLFLDEPPDDRGVVGEGDEAAEAAGRARRRDRRLRSTSDWTAE